MIVYEGTKNDFLNSVVNDTIAIEIQNKILEKMGRHTPESEFMSWNNSMNHMFKVMSDQEIPEDAGIAIEYNIPLSAKRVDFMISGYDDNHNPNVIIVELKQWSELKKVESIEAVVETYIGGSLRRVVHPSYQAWSYAQFINDFNSSIVDNDVKLHPCAYLHNYRRIENDPIDDKQYEEYTNCAPTFTMGEAAKLREYIKKTIKYGDKKEILYSVDHGKIKPSKSLQDCIVSLIEGNKEFTMIDEQKVVYESICDYSNKCQKDGKKRTIICKGGPGTGKSVIAINLLVELSKRGQFVQYVSKNTAPREVYSAKLKNCIKKTSIDNMFKGSGSFTETSNNTFGTLLVDEAHRLNEKSGMFKNIGENQIKEIIYSSLCSVFFIDDHQRVTLSDIGSVNEIKKWVKYNNSEIIEMELSSQFRCNGSNGYLAWIDNVLQIEETANYSLDGLDYEFKVFDSPSEMANRIFELNRSNNRSRILAGYCWNWPKEGRNDTNFHDIKIGDFEMSWNLDDGESFAISPTSVNEIGCIHTSQGLEFDYVGVIIGDDLRFENGKVITDFTKRAKTDNSLKGIKAMYDDNPLEAIKCADEIIKNTYRTLMTRGMKGCFVYCTNKELREHLKESVNNINRHLKVF